MIEVGKSEQVSSAFEIDMERAVFLRTELINKLKELGADCVGVTDVSVLKNGYSETLFPNMKDNTRDRYAEIITTGLAHGQVAWEADAQSVIVFAVSHPEDKPEMDWWCGEIDPPGNTRLLEISRAFKAYMAKEHADISVYPKRYHVERGGIYLKEAAAAAGLGCIGYNNLLVTPQFGPRVRLRAITIGTWLPPTGPIDFDPCKDCDRPCKKHCPQDAFARQIYTQEETGLEKLPGRDGNYYRASCNEQMEYDENTAQLGMMPEVCDHEERIIKYCRNCELYCKVGK